MIKQSKNNSLTQPNFQPFQANIGGKSPVFQKKID
jgi:hypothetical protein